MHEFSVHDTKTHLSKLLKLVESGESVVIKRGHKAVARLIPIESNAPLRKWGQDKGLIEIPEDFDAPLPPEILQHFLS